MLPDRDPVIWLLASFVEASTFRAEHIMMTYDPFKDLRACWQIGAKVLLDCCQSAPHMPIDVQQLGADWIVASGHKMCGPTGIGFLWGR